MRDTVVILHQEVGPEAPADELDVLDQVECVERELRDMGYRVRTLPFDLDLRNLARRIHKLHPALAFNLVETVMGDGRLAPLVCSFLDHLGIPYTGSGAQAMLLTTNKTMAKRWMGPWGIPTPEWFEPGRPSEGAPPFPATYILKPVWEDASVGIEAGCVIEAEETSALVKALHDLERSIHKPCFAERFIDGREFNLALLACGDSVEVLPVCEIVFDLPEGMPRIVGYRAKWAEESVEFKGTVRVTDFPGEDSALLERLRRTALACWDLFDLRGYARVDMRVDREGRPFVLEINANPCISPDSGFCAAASKAGLAFRDIVERIVQAAARPPVQGRLEPCR
ncbi:MAG TPA: ATP-grasp domain-containing protein [Deltaproteobacteria bacterium]|nr:ATP-grasp domain-containing protein [Deltaproteobacteria bacterium]HPP80224.1 ATP-grasp domain-containing protein [Deltaproteobacteria bacterium]